MDSQLECKPPVAYGDAFFDSQQEGALQSARIVLPLVKHLLRPTSVIDVGCGRGAWLRAFQELGVSTICGLDGEYVDRAKLLIPPECFTCTDLSKPFNVEGHYDLGICLEVAEHLPEEMASILVRNLVDAAPAVLFSAAAPGQGGTHHINEQMPAYWRALFRRHGYVLLDAIRPAILTDARIEWWYRQNTVLYVSEDLLRERPSLAAYGVPEDGLDVQWLYGHMLNRPKDVVRSSPDESTGFPPVSVVIPTYNRGEILCQTMAMALAQDYPDFEVIVVDQTPEPPQAVRAYVEAAGERLRYVHRPVPNLPAARNAGVRMARGEIIVFIDDDVVIGTGYVASHAAKYRNRALGGVTGITLSPGDDDEAAVLRRCLGAFWMRTRLADGSFETYSMEGCNCSLRREAIIRAGMFDERFTGSAWGEDTDLGLRVKHLGYLLVLDPRIRLVHLALRTGGCGNRSATEKRVLREHHRFFIYHIMKNRTIFGSARMFAILWRSYRTYALNRQTLRSPLIFATNHWRFLCDLSNAVWAVLQGPLVSQTDTVA